MNFISRYLPVVVAVLFLAVYFRASLHADQAEAGETFAESRGTPPALMLQDLQGHPHTLDEFRGRVVLVHFWATWCGPCRAELPELTEFARRFKSKGLSVVAVDVGEPSPTIVHFTMKQPVPGLILRGGPRIAADQWNAEGIPASFLLDRDGTIRASRVGGMDWSAPQTTQWVERLLAQGAGPAAVR